VNFFFEVEHVIPTGRGGDDDEANLALACRACNLHKSDHLDRHDAEAGAPARLFNPRRDTWEDHFQVDRESCLIIGLTPIGRATIARLRLNSLAQVTAREHWLRLGLFP